MWAEKFGLTSPYDDGDDDDKDSMKLLLLSFQHQTAGTCLCTHTWILHAILNSIEIHETGGGQVRAVESVLLLLKKKATNIT